MKSAKKDLSKCTKKHLDLANRRVRTELKLKSVLVILLEAFPEGVVVERKFGLLSLYFFRVAARVQLCLRLLPLLWILEGFGVDSFL